MNKNTKAHKLQKRADQLWSVIIKRPARCLRCRGTFALSPHHIIYRSQSNWLRHDIQNGIPLCRGCHFWIHHASPTVVNEWLVGVVGQERIDHLNAQHHQIIKANSAFWEKRIAELERIIGRPY